MVLHIILHCLEALEFSEILVRQWSLWVLVCLDLQLRDLLSGLNFGWVWHVGFDINLAERWRRVIVLLTFIGWIELRIILFRLIKMEDITLIRLILEGQLVLIYGVHEWFLIWLVHDSVRTRRVRYLRYRCLIPGGHQSFENSQVHLVFVFILLSLIFEYVEEF